MIENQYKQNLLNAWSYSGTYAISDHILVITTIVINWIQVHKKKNPVKKDKKMKIDTQKLVHHPETKIRFKEKLE